MKEMVEYTRTNIHIHTDGQSEVHLRYYLTLLLKDLSSSYLMR